MGKSQHYHFSQFLVQNYQRILAKKLIKIFATFREKAKPKIYFPTICLNWLGQEIEFKFLDKNE